MPKKKCPYCKREIDSVFYTEWGQKVWSGKEWEEDKGGVAVRNSAALSAMALSRFLFVFAIDPGSHSPLHLDLAPHQSLYQP